jgi:hypothetical protein
MEHETQDQETRLEAVIAGARGVERPGNTPEGPPEEGTSDPETKATPPNRRWLRLRWSAREQNGDT